MAANLDRLLVVVSVADPPPSRFVIDRMLVMGESGGMACQLVLNKVDLPGCAAVVAELMRAYGAAGYPVLPTSAVTGAGIGAFRAVIRSRVVGAGGAVGGGEVVASEPDRTRARPAHPLRGAALQGGTAHHRVEPPDRALGGWPRCRHTGVFRRGASVACVPLRWGGASPSFRPFLGALPLQRLHPTPMSPGARLARPRPPGQIQQERHTSYRTILEELQQVREMMRRPVDETCVGEAARAGI